MIGRLVLSELRHRPGRVLFLLVGYAFGVAVMVVLLSVGQAMLTQAGDESLMGGGDVLLVPSGISPDMIRGGGTGALFMGIGQARFLQRLVLESPRGRDDYGIVAASPIVDGRAVEITFRGRTVQALAAGEIPSRAAAAGAAPQLLSGEWRDSEVDRRWAEPDPSTLLHEIDRFHLPYGSAQGDSTWAEWHYFNVGLDGDRWLYVTYMLAGRIGMPGQWGGRLLVTVREPAGGHRNFTRDFTPASIVFDTTRADLVLGEDASVRVVDGRYQLRALLGVIDLQLTIQPLENRFFPPTSLGGAEAVSGYVVPALAARAEGRVCLPAAGTRSCEAVAGVRAYHDHNWGVWRDVAWDWGAASDEEVSLLYGSVRGPGMPDQGLFAYLVDGRGARGVFRPSAVEALGERGVQVGGRTVEVPTSLRFIDSRRGLEVTIDAEDYQVTDMERDVDRYFVQMAGTATVREAGMEARRLRGFFEVYVD